MSELIASTVDAATSAQTSVVDGSSATLIASYGIKLGEECVIEVATTADIWRKIPDTLSASDPAISIAGPLTFRVIKPPSTDAYGVEIEV